MRYHHETPDFYYFQKAYIVDHPLYDRATLYSKDGFGLCVIQQRLDGKKTYWTEIDDWLVEEIRSAKGFSTYFWQHAGKMRKDGIYPTVTVRQIMWSLRLKPIKRERWETVFDHKPL